MGQAAGIVGGFSARCEIQPGCGIALQTLQDRGALRRNVTGLVLPDLAAGPVHALQVIIQRHGQTPQVAAPLLRPVERAAFGVGGRVVVGGRAERIAALVGIGEAAGGDAVGHRAGAGR